MKKLPGDIAQQMEMLKAETRPTHRKGAELVVPLFAPCRLYLTGGIHFDMVIQSGTEDEVRKWAKANGYRIVKVTHANS